MRNVAKNWIWFGLLMALILCVGILVATNRRREPGESLRYCIDEFRKVDESLVRYHELQALVASKQIGALRALAVFPDGAVFVGGENGLQQLQMQHVPLLLKGGATCLAYDQTGMYWAKTNRIECAREIAWNLPGEKAYITSIAVSDEYVFAADAGNRCIWRFNKSGEGDPFVIESPRGFVVPSPFFDIAITPEGTLWAVNPGRHSFEHYRPDGTLIEHWEKVSMQIEGFSGCCNPSHIALLPDGAFVTAEKGLARIKIHERDGSFRCVVAAPDQFEAGITGLDLATDSDGKIYVLDPSRGVVRVFEEKL